VRSLLPIALAAVLVPVVGHADTRQTNTDRVIKALRDNNCAISSRNRNEMAGGDQSARRAIDAVIYEQILMGNISFRKKQYKLSKSVCAGEKPQALKRARVFTVPQAKRMIQKTFAANGCKMHYDAYKAAIKKAGFVVPYRKTDRFQKANFEGLKKQKTVIDKARLEPYNARLIVVDPQNRKIGYSKGKGCN
jgi:hypothetical protein